MIADLTVLGLPARSLAGFVAASAVLIAVPGPNVALILGISATRGLRAGLSTVAGATAAQGAQIALAAGGLAWLAEAWGGAFEALRLLGAAWLLWLGIGMWRSARERGGERAPPAAALSAAARRGFLVGLANPKSLAFHAAFLPQFVDAGAPAGPQLALLGAVYLLVAGALDSGWALLGAGGARALGDRAGQAAHAWMTRGAGAALIGGAAWLLLDRRR